MVLLVKGISIIYVSVFFFYVFCWILIFEDEGRLGRERWSMGRGCEGIGFVFFVFEL